MPVLQETIVISFHAVSKVYGEGDHRVTAVDDLTIDIPTGKITVFVGPSGCGKTTSVRMINRMVEPTSGTVAIDGTDTRSVDAPTLRRGIGYVIQNAGLFPHRTVVDNIATVPVLQGMSRRQARSVASGLLERVGLPAAMGRRYPAQLSGGQQQRVGVARALAADPPVMLMDEPFSAVDPVVRAQLQEEFIRLQDELGKTIVFVTHDIDEAIKLGDRIAVMAVGGRLAQYAPPSEVLTRPADDFVADFVGRDRGYRALSFAAAGHLPIYDEPTARLGRPISSDAAGAPGRRPRGVALVAGRRRRSPPPRLGGRPPAGRRAGRGARPRARRIPGAPGLVAAHGPGRRPVIPVRPRGCGRRGRASDRHAARSRGARRHRCGAPRDGRRGGARDCGRPGRGRLAEPPERGAVVS